MYLQLCYIEMPNMTQGVACTEIMQSATIPLAVKALYSSVTVPDAIDSQGSNTYAKLYRTPSHS